MYDWSVAPNPRLSIYDDWTDSGMDIVTECNVDAMADMWATSDFTKELPDPYECLE